MQSFEQSAEKVQSPEKKLRRSSFADDWGGEASLNDLSKDEIEMAKNASVMASSLRAPKVPRMDLPMQMKSNQKAVY